MLNEKGKEKEKVPLLNVIKQTQKVEKEVFPKRPVKAVFIISFRAIICCRALDIKELQSHTQPPSDLSPGLCGFSTPVIHRFQHMFLSTFSLSYFRLKQIKLTKLIYFF